MPRLFNLKQQFSNFEVILQQNDDACFISYTNGNKYAFMHMLFVLCIFMKTKIKKKLMCIHCEAQQENAYYVCVKHNVIGYMTSQERNE